MKNLAQEALRDSAVRLRERIEEFDRIEERAAEEGKSASNPAAARWAERDRKRAEAAVEVVRTRCLWCDWFFDGPMALGKQELETHRCRDGHNQPTSLPPGGDWYSTADPEERPSRITLRPRPQAVA